MRASQNAGSRRILVLAAPYWQDTHTESCFADRTQTGLSVFLPVHGHSTSSDTTALIQPQHFSTQNFSWAWPSKELVSPQTTLAWVLNSIWGCRSNQSKLTRRDWVCFMTPLPLCPSYPFIHFTLPFSFENVKHCPGVLFPIPWTSCSCVGLCTIILIFTRKKHTLTHTNAESVEHFVPDDPAVTCNSKAFACLLTFLWGRLTGSGTQTHCQCHTTSCPTFPLTRACFQYIHLNFLSIRAKGSWNYGTV